MTLENVYQTCRLILPDGMIPRILDAHKEASSTVDKVERVEYDFVAILYWALADHCRGGPPAAADHAMHGPRTQGGANALL